VRRKTFLSAVALMFFVTGCAATSQNVKTVVLPTSNKSIDVVQHRSDVKFLDCGTLVVLQTYDSAGKLIDSKDAHGAALHCGALNAAIAAGGRVGAAAAAQAARSTTSNVLSQGQVQGQAAVSVSEANAQGGAGGNGGAGGAGGHGNNGGGNGSGDGTNPGTDHHHDNGDNN